MAAQSHVKAYLACWLQIGKGIDLELPHAPQAVKLDTVLSARGYSSEFERLWSLVLAHPDRCYLSGQNETIAELLSERWEIVDCGRCGLYVPVTGIALSTHDPCPCSDIGDWPNLDTVQPRQWTNEADWSKSHLVAVRKRLQRQPVTQP